MVFCLLRYIPDSAQQLIQALLQSDPKKRPKIEESARYEWFRGFTPESLPASVLISAPRFTCLEDKNNLKQRRPLIEVNSAGTYMHSHHTHDRRPYQLNHRGWLVKTIYVCRASIRRKLHWKLQKSGPRDVIRVVAFLMAWASACCFFCNLQRIEALHKEMVFTILS